MKFEELKESIKEDLKIDLRDLENAAANNSLLYHKYNTILTESKVHFRKLWIKHQETKKRTYRYYTGLEEECPPETLDSTGVKFHMAGDKDMLEDQKIMFMLEEKIKYLESACQNFISRGFNIKNIIDLRKLESGI